MANLDCLETKENADNGVWFRVKLYGKEQPFSLKILGSDSDEVVKYAKEKLRKIRDSNKEDGSLEALLDSNDNDVVVRLCGIRSEDDEKKVILGNRELKNDKESYKFMIEKIPALKEFVLEKSNERKNFLSEKKKD